VCRPENDKRVNLFPALFYSREYQTCHITTENPPCMGHNPANDGAGQINI
jgi:hypothetical protein